MKKQQISSAIQRLNLLFIVVLMIYLYASVIYLPLGRRLFRHFDIGRGSKDLNYTGTPIEYRRMFLTAVFIVLNYIQ